MDIRLQDSETAGPSLERNYMGLSPDGMQGIPKPYS